VPFATSPTWEFLIQDNAGGDVADLSAYVMSPSVGPRLSQPSLQTWRLPLIPEVLALGPFEAGLHRGVAIRNGDVVANDILWRVKPQGGPSDAYADLEFIGPMQRWATRYCQDADAQIFDGVSADGSDRGMDLPVGIVANPLMSFAAADMLEQALANTIAIDGDLGIALGTFSTTPNTQNAFMFAMRNLAPCRISELMSAMREAGACDVMITPSSGATMGTVSALDRIGIDLPGVHFDYGTGANNVAWAYPETSMDEFCDKLWYELPPRIDTNHFANNVTEDAPGTTTNPSAAQAAFGVYHDIIVHSGWSGSMYTRLPSGPGDTLPYGGAINPLYQMYVTRWNAELAARMAPRQLIRIVPQPGVAPAPWDDYNLGDTPRLNLGNLGLDVSGAAFRIIGWDAKPQDDGGEQVDLLIGWAPE